MNGEWSLMGHNLLKLFRFGVNLGKARADWNFGVVSTALDLGAGWGNRVVAIHWR